ncbi:MAG: hypothetical protein ABWY06_07855 [Pseudomonas sp.]|uniref:hypothetical protein n=1 Tax=Pseudomonas sp. TaxID=306 RepID=UPI003398074B
MKKLSHLYLIGALFAWLPAVAQEHLSWRTDGTVIRDGTPLKTRLQVVYSALAADQGLYLAGDIIDSKGINHPQIVFVAADQSTPQYWPQTHSVNQFFLYQGHTYSVLYNGQALVRKGKQWLPSPLAFKQDPTVVYNRDDLVACTPRPLEKETRVQGSCYSLGKGWSTDIDWQHTAPAVCQGTLTALVKVRKQWLAQQLSLADGRLLASAPLAQPVNDLCSIRFDKP